MWSWWQGLKDKLVARMERSAIRGWCKWRRRSRITLRSIRATKSSPSPPILPDLFADHAIDARLTAGGGHDRAFGGAAGDLEQQFGADRFLELVAVLDRDDERTGATDHAVLVIEIEIVDIHGGVGRLLHHDRQAVDNDTLFHRGIARDDDRCAVVVGAITGNIDHPAQAAVRVLVEQRHGEVDRPRDRGARRAAD